MADQSEEGYKELEEILFRIKRAKDFSKGWHQSVVHWRNLYEGSHYVGQPKPNPGESRYADPTYTNSVDLAVGIFLSNEIVWRATGWEPTAAEQNATSQAERYISALLDINSDRREYNIPYELLLHFVRDGGGILYSVWDPIIHNKAKDRVFSELPLDVQVVDPLNIILLPGGSKRWQVIAKCEESTVYDVETLYGVELEDHKGKSRNEKMNIKGEFINYWERAIESEKEVVKSALLFEEEFIRKPSIMTGYDDLPFSIGFFKPVSRIASGGWHSIMTPLIESVKELERSFNRRQRQIDVYSALPLVSKTADGRTISTDPGMPKIVGLRQDEDIGFPSWLGNPPDVERQIEFLRGRVQQSGFADSMYGEGASVASGYALSQMGDQGRIRLEQPITHIEQMLSWWARKAISLTLAFARGSKLRVYGRVRGEDFASEVLADVLDNLFISCELRPEFPNERVRNHAMAVQVKGIVSDATIMEEYLNIQQPDQERSKKLLEMAQQHPILMNYILMAKLQEMAELGDQAAVLALQEIQQQITAGQAGRPTEPNAPPQPLGLQGANGQPSPGAMGTPVGGPASQQQGMANAAPNMQGGVG